MNDEQRLERLDGPILVYESVRGIVVLVPETLTLRELQMLGLEGQLRARFGSRWHQDTAWELANKEGYVFAVFEPFPCRG